MVLPLALIGLGLTAAGTAAQYYGQRKAAEQQKKTMAQALAEQKALREKSRALATAEIAHQTPEALGQEIDQGKAVAATVSDQGNEIARAFADRTGGTGAYRGELTNASGSAAADSARDSSNDAVQRSFSQALLNRGQRMKGLAVEQQMLGQDSEDAAARLPQRMELAGQYGMGLRTAGTIAGGVGMGLANYGAWSEKPAAVPAGGQALDGFTPLVRTVDPTTGRVVWRSQ